VSAEVDHLLGARFEQVARRAFLDDLAAGRFLVEGLTQREHGTVADLDRRYADFAVGLADLSVVVLAGRFRSRDVLTFDERHFRTLRPLQGGAFRLLPADA
jgi:predicted nucleic acid-binding protein